MSEFVEIPHSLLESIATGAPGLPIHYFRGNPLSRKVFWMRLRRLHQLAGIYADREQSCLDFASGSGIFLPTLASHFRSVVAIDLKTTEASLIVDHYGLDNVTLVQDDVTTATLEQAPFRAIFAADVLEHFPDLSVPIPILHRWLADDGYLFTSLPTENFFYVLLRAILGVVKPKDHYHTAQEVEDYLRGHGFERLRRWCVPLRPPIAPLFLVSAWRKVCGP